jgi:hypothetical protein
MFMQSSAWAPSTWPHRARSRPRPPRRHVACKVRTPHPVARAAQVGEFVEVSNGSKTDPGAWLGCVSEVLNGSYEVRMARAGQGRMQGPRAPCA